MLRSLAQQQADMRVRASKASQEERDNMNYILQVEKDLIESEHKKQRDARERRVRNASELREQLKDRQHDNGKMSQEEIRINRQKLKAFIQAKNEGRFANFEDRLKYSSLA